jgi:hypothetical protein
LGLQGDLPRRVTAYLVAHYVSEQLYYDQVFNKNYPVDAYTRVDARLAFGFGPKDNAWTAGVMATNLFNNGHREFPDVVNASTGGEDMSLPQPRTAWVTLAGHF